MVKFQIITLHSFNQLFVRDWSIVQTGKIVDKTGKSATKEYAGRRYRLIALERTFSSHVYIGRCLLGIIAVICTLGIVLFSETVRNLFHKKLIKHFGLHHNRISEDLEMQPQSLMGLLANNRPLPEELGLEIFSYLGGHELAQCCSVSRNFTLFTSRDIVWERAIAKKAIGKGVWSFLDVVNINGQIGIGDEPPLPYDIYDLLCTPSPSSTNKTYGQTHPLILFPNTQFQNESFYLAQLEEIIIRRWPEKSGRDFKYNPYNNIIFKQKPSDRSFWVLFPPLY